MLVGIAYRELLFRYSEQYIGIFAANIPCLRSLLQEAFRALGGHITAYGSKNRTYGNENDSSTKDIHQSQLEDGTKYHHYVQKDDLEMMGTGGSKQVLVTHQIETSVGKRDPSDCWDNAPESKWDIES
jgi:hypothetical protein